MNSLRLETKKRNLVLILSSVLTTRANIRWTVTFVYSENTGLAEIGIIRSHKSSKKLEPI